MTANGAETYAWSNGETGNAINISPTETATLSVIGTTLGCSASETVFVNVNPLPMINLGLDILLPAGQNAILDAGNGLTYQWSTGAATAIIEVNSMGVYAVTVTNPAGCTAADSILVTIVVSTNVQNDQFRLSIMPNPVHDLVSIICLGSTTSSVQVLDNLGRTLVEDNAFLIDGATRMLNLEQLPPSTYFLKIIGNGFIKIVPIIKQ